MIRRRQRKQGSGDHLLHGKRAKLPKFDAADASCEDRELLPSIMSVSFSLCLSEINSVRLSRHSHDGGGIEIYTAILCEWRES